MKITVDTHTHSIVSGHAYSTIRELAMAAADRGLEAIALTEHGPALPGSVGNIYFINYYKAPREIAGVKLLYGAELNILDNQGNMDLPEQTCIKHLDIAIASIHTDCFDTNVSAEDLMSAYIGAMNKPYVNIIGHPDDGRFPDIDYERLVREAKRTNTMLELNCASLDPHILRKDPKEKMRTLMKVCSAEGVHVVVGTDAHSEAFVGDFHAVEEFIEEEGFPWELVANTSLEKLQSLLQAKGI